jgi:AbrB family looped-hinge helix DNA binding protein
LKITTKGQVTIPQRLRERYGLLPGTEVTFEDADGGVQLKKKDSRMSRGRALVEHMRGRARTRLSTDDIMALTRGES